MPSGQQLRDGLQAHELGAAFQPNHRQTHRRVERTRQIISAMSNRRDRHQMGLLDT